MFTVIALPLAGLLWFGMVILLSSSRTAGPVLNGLEAIAAIFCGFALWLMLAGMLAWSGADGRFTRWTGLAAPAVFVLSAIGAVQALGLRDHGVGWALTLVAIHPLLVALYAFRPHLWIAGAVALLTVPVMAVTATDVVPRRERGERIVAALHLREVQERGGYIKSGPREIEAFGKLGPDSHMGEYLRFLYGDLSTRAYEGIRAVNSRQADTVAMLKEDNGLARLAGLHDFDVAATPEVCAAYAKALDRVTTRVDPKGRSYYSGLELIQLERQRPNMRWLVGEGCDLSASLARLEKILRSVADMPFVNEFADELAELRAKRRG